MNRTIGVLVFLLLLVAPAGAREYGLLSPGLARLDGRWSFAILPVEGPGVLVRQRLVFADIIDEPDLGLVRYGRVPGKPYLRALAWADRDGSVVVVLPSVIICEVFRATPAGRRFEGVYELRDPECSEVYMTRAFRGRRY